MIHSMSGGVIRDPGTYTFVKAEISGTPGWYICDLPVEAGDTVIVPSGAGTAEAKVVRVEYNVSGQVAPVPAKRAKHVIKVLDKEE